jgi:hypothetical protein
VVALRLGGYDPDVPSLFDVLSDPRNGASRADAGDEDVLNGIPRLREGFLQGRLTLS